MTIAYEPDYAAPNVSEVFALKLRIEQQAARIAKLEAALGKMQRSRDRYRMAWEAEKSHGTARVRAALENTDGQ